MPKINRFALLLGAGLAYCVLRSLQNRTSSLDLQGKVVAITGGSRGLGLNLARAFGQEGARVALIARDADELERAKNQLKSDGIEAFTFAGDVTDTDDVHRFIQTVRDRFGRIEVLVNNAGVIEVGPMEEMVREDYEEAMAVHFWGPLTATLAVLPEMRARGEGRIVNISSVAGKLIAPHLLPYTASKHALVGLSEGMGIELASHGIFVTTVCPGLMRAGSAENAIFKGQNEKEYAWFKIADSLPGLTMSADRAARQIVDACKRGDAEVILTLPAFLAVKFHALMPNLDLRLQSLIARLFPAPGGIGLARALGSESHSAASQTPLSVLSDIAARENNELPRNGHISKTATR